MVRGPFARAHAWYEGLLPRLIARRKVVVGVFVLGLILLAVMFEITPQGFIPAEDQSLLYVLVTLPVQASMDQTTAAVKRLEKMMLAMPQVEAVTSGIGFGFANNSSNQATMFVQLKPLSQRGGVQNSALALQYQFYTQFAKVPGLTALPANPPAIPGLGTTGGFAIEIQDIDNLGLPALNRVGNAILADAKKDPALSQVRIPTILTGQYLATKFDRSKALAFGVTPQAFFDTISATTGVTLVNFFDYGTRSYQVLVQAKAGQRKSPADLSRIYVANTAGNMMPVSEFLHTGYISDNVAIMRFNEYNSFEIDGSPGRARAPATRCSPLRRSSRTTYPRGWRTTGAASRASKCRAARRRSSSFVWDCSSSFSFSSRSTRA